jgi:DNA-binding response OmpR family regulator
MTRFAIVEDSDSTNDHFRRVLEGAYPAAVVHQYKTMSEARAGLSSEKYDLVLLDIDLGPEVDERIGGFALAPLLKSSGAPVIIVSGSPPERQYKDIMTTLFAWDFLEKVVDDDELVALVRDLLEHVSATAGAPASEASGNTADPNLQITPFGRQRVSWKGADVVASSTHMKIIKELVDHHDNLVSYGDLLNLHPSSRKLQTLRVNINRIRDNFLDVDEDFHRIDNVTGRGYVWRLSED